MLSEHGRVDLLKCLFDLGIDKDVTDQQGKSLLWWLTHSSKVDGVRYLLDQGVVVPTYVSKARYI